MQSVRNCRRAQLLSRRDSNRPPVTSAVLRTGLRPRWEALPVHRVLQSTVQSMDAWARLHVNGIQAGPRASGALHPEAGNGSGSGDVDDGPVGSCLAVRRLPGPAPPRREAITELIHLRSAVCNWLIPEEPGVRARTGTYPAVWCLFHLTGLVLALQRERWPAAAAARRHGGRCRCWTRSWPGR